MLNNFTYENESNTTIPFLGILIIKSQNNLTFKSLPQTHEQNEFTPTTRAKLTGLIISFYFRALIMCSPQHLDEEFKYIEHSLKSLKYPKFFILNARIKNKKKKHPKNSTYIHQINLRKTLQQFSLPTNIHN